MGRRHPLSSGASREGWGGRRRERGGRGEGRVFMIGAGVVQFVLRMSSVQESRVGRMRQSQNSYFVTK